MSEFEQLVEHVERDLDTERCTAALPRLLELAGTDAVLRSRAHGLAARCNYVAGNMQAFEEEFRLASESAQHSLEARVRLKVQRASLYTSSGRIQESVTLLEEVAPYVDELTTEVQGLIFSIRGRNEAISGHYAEAIEYSQDAIGLSPPLSAAAAYAHGTISLVFHTMGRIEESEHFGLEQIRILKERGSEKWTAALYSMLSVGAASVHAYDRAYSYQQLASELSNTSQSASSSRTLSLMWTANSSLELGDLDGALEHASAALRIAREESNVSLELNAWMMLGRIHFERREYVKALEALTVPLNKDALVRENQRMNLYRWLTATYKALDRKAEAFDFCYRLWELQTDFETRTRDALLKYHRSLEQKIFAQKTSMLNMRSAQMERELALSATQLVAQVDLLSRFRNDLREIVRESQSPDPAMKKIKEKLKELPCQQIDWVNFEAQFSSVHPDFKSKLQEKHPDLTRSEMKICSLSRMKLTSEEIGRLLCLSDRTVQVHRLNIRKKLGLKTEQNLSTYLASLG